VALDAFKKQMGIDFALLSDYYPHGEVAQKYGVLFPNGRPTGRSSASTKKASSDT
jgi:peroxiredoxin